MNQIPGEKRLKIVLTFLSVQVPRETSSIISEDFFQLAAKSFLSLFIGKGHVTHIWHSKRK